MTVWGDTLDGRKYNTSRDYGMTKTEPPVDYRWHHQTANTGVGKDSTVTELAKETKAQLRDLRLNYLDQFELEVVEDGKYRYWRWLGGESSLRGAYIDRSGRPREVKWSERRSTDAPLPKTPGLWPADD